MTAHAERAAAKRVQGDSADDQRQLQEQLRCARDVHADLEEGAAMEGAQAASRTCRLQKEALPVLRGPSSSLGGPYLGTEQMQPRPPPPPPMTLTLRA